MDSLLLHSLETGDEIHRRQDSIVLTFKGPRKVLSTSRLNGGYREDLTAVFNHNINSGLGLQTDIHSGNYHEHMTLVAKALGLNPQSTAGLLTAAHMENAALKTNSYDDLSVTAIVTAGIDYNGGRVGDPAGFYERRGEVVSLTPGTINILLAINADMPEETLVRALVTCTEAKTAALQELMAGSCYSNGLATGSGTDGTVIIANSCSDLKLYYAGKHSKLGELIGLAVKAAVREALFLETGLSPKSQFSILKRFKRFGLEVESLWHTYRKYRNDQTPSLSYAEFEQLLTLVDRDENIVVPSTLYIHLLDQMNWGLISPSQAARAGRDIIVNVMASHGLSPGLDGLSPELDDLSQGIGFNNQEISDQNNPISIMVENYVQMILTLIAHRRTELYKACCQTDQRYGD